jgi:hypothetical protein
MHPTEGPQVCPKRCARPLTGVAVHLTPAISIIIARPLMHTVADRGMARMTSPIALPLISIEPRATSREILRDQGRAGARVRMGADPPALLPRRARNHTDDRGPVIGVSPMPFAFIGAPPRRVGGVWVRGAFFPPHCDRVRRRPRRYPPS